jgi:hypothetical protein
MRTSEKMISTITSLAMSSTTLQFLGRLLRMPRSRLKKTRIVSGTYPTLCIRIRLNGAWTIRSLTLRIRKSLVLLLVSSSWLHRPCEYPANNILVLQIQREHASYKMPESSTQKAATSAHHFRGTLRWLHHNRSVDNLGIRLASTSTVHQAIKV